MSFSAFISYSTRDLADANALRDWVAVAGATPFLAEYSVAPGRPLAADILAAIRGCDLFLLIWSTSARESEWVPQEVGIARGAGKPILPIVLEPGLELPGFLRDLKYLAVYRDPTSSVKWLHQHVAARVKEKADTAVVMGVIGAVLLLMAVHKR